MTAIKMLIILFVLSVFGTMETYTQSTTDMMTDSTSNGTMEDATTGEAATSPSGTGTTGPAETPGPTTTPPPAGTGTTGSTPTPTPTTAGTGTPGPTTTPSPAGTGTPGPTTTPSPAGTGTPGPTTTPSPAGPTSSPSTTTTVSTTTRALGNLTCYTCMTNTTTSGENDCSNVIGSAGTGSTTPTCFADQRCQTKRTTTGNDVYVSRGCHDDQCTADNTAGPYCMSTSGGSECIHCCSNANNCNSLYSGSSAQRYHGSLAATILTLAFTLTIIG